MDVKKTNTGFDKNQAILRDKLFGEAINGLIVSGKHNDDLDKLVAAAFEIAVKAVSYQDKLEGSRLNIFKGLFR